MQRLGEVRGVLAMDDLVKNFGSLPTKNMSGFSENDECEAPVIQKLWNDISSDNVQRLAKHIKKQKGGRTKGVEHTKMMLGLVKCG